MITIPQSLKVGIAAVSNMDWPTCVTITAELFEGSESGGSVTVFVIVPPTEKLGITRIRTT